MADLLKVVYDIDFIVYDHSKLLCQKRRNWLEVTSLKDLFFLAILKLNVKDSLGYLKEVKSMGKTFPKI